MCPPAKKKNSGRAMGWKFTLPGESGHKAEVEAGRGGQGNENITFSARPRAS